MATTNIRGAADAAASIEYVTLGRGEKRRRHLEEGTTRDVYRVCDMDDADFVSYAQQMAHANSRKWQLYELRVSFDTDELDPNNPEDHRRCAEMSYQIAERLYPGCKKNVYVHIDGEGGKVHSHVEVVNHDPITSHAITSKTSHRHVAAVADAVCKDNGLSAMGNVEETWVETCKQGELSAFEQELGNKIYSCLQSSSSTAEFKRMLEAEGIELHETVKAVKSADGEINVYGWSYSMIDRTGSRKRRRRRKASNLSGEFTRENVMTRFGELDEEEKTSAQAKVRERARSKRFRNDLANEQPDERLMCDESELKVDTVETVANFAELTNYCRFSRENREFYKELEERLGKNGTGRLLHDIELMDAELERAKRRVKEDAAERAQLRKHPEAVAYKAAANAAKRDDGAVAVALLLMLACTMTMQRSFFAGIASGKLTRSRKRMFDIENRRHAAAVVGSQFTDVTDDGVDVRVGSRTFHDSAPRVQRAPRRQHHQPQRTSVYSL